MNNIISTIENNYYFKVSKIEIFNRSRIDYNINLDRKVYRIIDDSKNEYILKILISWELEYLESLFHNLEINKFTNTIFPIKNNDWLFITNYLWVKYIVFPSLILNKFNNKDLWLIFEKYKKLHSCINLINKNNFSNNYVNNIEYFIKFTQSNNIHFTKILNHLKIDEKYFYKNIEEYLNFIQKQNLNIIYSSLREWNIYKINNKIHLIDLDSIKIGDIFFDMCSYIILINQFNPVDLEIKYKLYNETLNYFVNESWYNIENYKFITWLMYYFSFMIFNEDIFIWNSEIKIILKDIINSYNYTKDFINYIEKHYKNNVYKV